MSENRQLILKDFGARVKNIRLKRGLTQIEVSSRMNRDQQSLQRVESGRVNPSLCYLIELSSALEIEVSELVCFDVEKK